MFDRAHAYIGRILPRLYITMSKCSYGIVGHCWIFLLQKAIYNKHGSVPRAVYVAQCKSSK